MRRGGKGNKFQQQRQREANLRGRVSHGGGGTATVAKVVVNFPKNCCSLCPGQPYVAPQNQAAHRVWHQQRGH